MWLYFNVKKRLTHKLDLTYATPTFTPPQRYSISERTEHAQRIEGIDGTWCYGRKVMLDAHSYEFDRFDLNGSAIFVRNE